MDTKKENDCSIEDKHPAEDFSIGNDTYNVSLKKCSSTLVGPHNHINASVVNINGLPEFKKKPYTISRRGYLIIGSTFLLLLMILLSIGLYIYVFQPNGNNFTTTKSTATNNYNKVTPTTFQPPAKATSPKTEERQTNKKTEITQITEKNDEVTETTVHTLATEKPDTWENRHRTVYRDEVTSTPEHESDHKKKNPPQEGPKEPASPLIIANDEWGGPKPLKSWCTEYVITDVVIVDNLKVNGCNSMKDCIKVLKDNQTLDSNFFIGNDGHVYENRGWNCLSNIKQDIYSLTHSIKITFIGHYVVNGLTELQKKVFQLLIEDGIKKVVLRKNNYLLFPRCEDTDPEIYRFLRTSPHYKLACQD